MSWSDAIIGIPFPARFNTAGVNHIDVELDHAIDLCEAARATPSEKTAERLLADASSSYRRALKLVPRVRLNPQDAHEIKQKCVRLQALLVKVEALASA